MTMKKVSRIQHVEEVELCIDRDGSLHPGIVGSRTFGHCQLLKQISWLVSYFNINFLVGNFCEHLNQFLGLPYVIWCGVA